jgi:sec-independent protein translocase protein TatB
MWDSLILMVMALVVFGPRRLPEIGRKAGRIMYELRKASNDFKFQMEEELRKADEADLRKKEKAQPDALALTAPADFQIPEAGSETPNAQISESGTPEVDAPAAVESPYPGGAVYPPVIAAEPKTTAEETLPAAQIEALGENAANEPPTETPTDESALVAEQAHHA